MRVWHVVCPGGGAVVVVDEPGLVVDVPAVVVDEAPAVVVAFWPDLATIGSVLIVRPAAWPDVDVSAAGFVVVGPLTAPFVVVEPAPVVVLPVPVVDVSGFAVQGMT